MGINIILPLIIGMALMVSLGSQVVPSFVEQMKIKKVENRTIANQNLIKDAIVRYIKIKGEVPDHKKGLKDLEDAGLIQEHHKDNFFSNGGYSFEIDKKLGTLKIFTTINDDVAGKYFSNSFKFPNAPTCIEFDQKNACTGKFETFYLLDEDTFKSIPIPKVGSIEDIQDRFTKAEEVGKKYDGTTLETTLVDGAKDYIVDLDTKEVTEYTYDKENNIWVENPTKIVVPSLNPSDHGVEIKNITWDFIDGLGNKIKQTHEKVVCKYDLTKSDQITIFNNHVSDKEFFVVNQITGLGEIVWVAPDSRNIIKIKIFGGSDATSLARSDFAFNPNNICTSNVTKINGMFVSAENFNQPLNRWDTSNVTNMISMFNNATSFNQPIGNWDTSNVTSMERMFFNATNFNQDLSSWCVKNIENYTDYNYNTIMETNEAYQPNWEDICPPNP